MSLALLDPPPTIDRFCESSLDIGLYEEAFAEHFQRLRTIDLNDLESYFLGIPLELMPLQFDWMGYDSAHRTFTQTEVSDILQLFLEVADREGFDSLEDPRVYTDPIKPLLNEAEKISALQNWLADGITTSEVDNKTLDGILNANGDTIPSYLLTNTPADRVKMAQSYCPFIELIHSSKDNFVIYLGRDAAQLFEVDSYMAKIQNIPKRAGLIYHGGLKINYKEFTVANDVVIEVMGSVSSQLLKKVDLSQKNINQDRRKGAYDKEAKIDWTQIDWELRNTYKNSGDQQVFRKFEEEFFKEIARRLDFGQVNGTAFYQQSLRLYAQMKNTGIFESRARKATFVDTAGSGKTILYAKAVFDYFSRLECHNIESGVLLIDRYQNYTDRGQANIPGFPVVIEAIEQGKEPYASLVKEHNIDPKYLAKESDIQPFYASEVLEGNAVLRPNPISAQLMCLVRSLINWNEAVSYSERENIPRSYSEKMLITSSS